MQKNESEQNSSENNMIENISSLKSEEIEKIVNQTNGEVESRNFVENFKRFFSRKFKSNNSNQQTIKTEIPVPESETAQQISSSSNQTSQASLNEAILSEKKIEETSANDPNTIERYKQIIEEYKDLLPKNFIIRRFPSSSCQDTFGESENREKETENNSDLQLTSSPSLTPSPINPYLPGGNEDDDAFLNSSGKSELTKNKEKAQDGFENQLNSKKTTNNANLFEDMNQSNKRFYHVFRRNELDDLIKNSCSSLKIYDSYYDHGNWCICAIKEAT